MNSRLYAPIAPETGTPDTQAETHLTAAPSYLLLFFFFFPLFTTQTAATITISSAAPPARHAYSRIGLSSHVSAPCALLAAVPFTALLTAAVGPL